MKELKEYLNLTGEVVLMSEPNHFDFEHAYIATRKKEERVLNDKEVLGLPEIGKQNPHFREWKIRKHSSSKLIECLYKRRLTDKDWILDVGAGNGWFSNILAKELKANVLAIDINMHELEQAARVFNQKNVIFAYLDLLKKPLEHQSCATIIFNSSFQYFDDPKQVLDLCLKMLSKDGEIHIIDSPIYEQDKIAAAKQRSLEYYLQLDCQHMAEYYHHHNKSLFEQYNTTYLYQPNSDKPARREFDSPFPWLLIKA